MKRYLSMAAALILSGGLHSCASSPAAPPESEEIAMAPDGRLPTEKVEIDAAPIGAMIQIQNGALQRPPVEVTLEVNQYGRLMRSVRITVDFSSIYLGSKYNRPETHSTLTLKAGEKPPRRIVFTNTSIAGIRSEVTPR